MTDAASDPEAEPDQGPSGNETARSSTHRVRPMFAVALATLLSAYVVVAVANWNATGMSPVRRMSDGIAGMRLAVWKWRSSLRDPSPGTRLPTPGSVPDAAKTGAVDVVVFAEAAPSCCGGKAAGVASMVEQMARENAGLRKVKWILVVGGPEEASQGEPASDSPGLYSAVRDRSGALAKLYNSYFTPRTYILRDGALMWAQPSPSADDLMPVNTILENLKRAVAGP